MKSTPTFETQTTHHSTPANHSRNPRPPSLNTTSGNHDMTHQPPKHLLRASSTFYERIITDWWWWELGSCLVSFLCIAAIFGVLLFYSGKRQPEHVIAGLTLNTYVAVFAALSKAALILPVSEAIGQLKWIWFRRGAALQDFHLFDAASRGPWGSMMLLIRTRCMWVVTICFTVHPADQHIGISFLSVLWLLFLPLPSNLSFNR
jgi:hypothetical protein